MMGRNTITIGWNGLPHYAARQLAFARQSLGVSFKVIGTHADLPVSRIEEIPREDLYWIDRGKLLRWSDIGLEIPEVFFHTGWRYPHFTGLATEVRKSGGKVVGMFDNSWRGSPRQLIGGIVFKAMIRNRYAAVMVPGKSGTKLAAYLGFKRSQVFQGMYGACPETFSDRRPMRGRARKFLFVGRLEERKSVLQIAEAFSTLRGRLGDWRLKFIGEGPLAGALKEVPHVEVAQFADSGTVAREMNDARVLILASRLDHWGVVVHEAALCGCALLLTEGVGAGEDLAVGGNSMVIRRPTVREISRGMERMARMPDDWYENASRESRNLAANFGPEVWTRQFNTILTYLGRPLQPD